MTISASPTGRTAGRSVSERAEARAPRTRPGSFTAPDRGPREPLVRIDARIAPAPSVDGPPQSQEQPALGTEADTTRGRRSILAEPHEPIKPRQDAEEDGEGNRRRPTELAGLREEARQISAIARIVCQATLEALAGARPAAQLQRWMEPEVRAKVAERAQLMTEARKGTAASADAPPVAPGAVQIHRLRSDRVRTGVWEVAVVLSDKNRTRACALRFEAHRRRWRVVALELG